MLAALLGNHPDELRADLQRFFGLNLDRMGLDYTVAHAAACAANLPREAACVRAVAPEAAWSDETYLLSACEYLLNIIAWQNTKDGAKGRNKPKRPQTPADVARERGKVADTDFGAIVRMLNEEEGEANG